MRYLYNLLLYFSIPFVFVRFIWRSRRLVGYRQRLNERFGFVTPIPPKQETLWIHAVSIGELIAAAPLIEALLIRYPRYRVVVTTTTPTGAMETQKQFGNRVMHLYLPIDLPGAVQRFLHRIHPKLGIIMETELWPNLLHYAHKKQIPILLANARLSERSYLGYQRILSLSHEMLSHITLVAAQSEMDGQRFIALGLDPQKLILTGNIKFDLQLSPSLIIEGKSLRHLWNNRPTLIAASTHEGEEEIVLRAFRLIRRIHRDVLLILVPRHPDRFNKIADLCESYGFNISKRSLNETPHRHTDVLLGDTMGELRLLYAASDIAFVGGSLVPIGGHNLIEPASLSLSILTGHHLHNFTSIAHLLSEANAVTLITDEESLAESVINLLEHPNENKAMGERAHQVSIANKGAVEHHLQWIDTCLN